MSQKYSLNNNFKYNILKFDKTLLIRLKLFNYWTVRKTKIEKKNDGYNFRSNLNNYKRNVQFYFV